VSRTSSTIDDEGAGETGPGGDGPDGGSGDRASRSAERSGTTVESRIPARLDRLPWSSWHWRIIIGLGTVWILDGLEVTVVGSIAGRISEHGSGVAISSASVSGLTAALYVAGACTGALLFGQLTDRFGRKRLFMVTLGLYLLATTLTAFSFAPWWLYLFRYLTGMGIGGEYSAVNSAIDELIPARVRGRVDIVINGSYWLGAAGGAGLSVVALNTSIFPLWLGWRLAFGLGAVLGLVILLVRRHVPESPRWLLIHGREREAEELVAGIEQHVAKAHGELDEPGESITIKQRRVIPLTEIVRTLVRSYPKRSILGLGLFVGQAFLYNAILFGYTTVLANFFGVATSSGPYYLMAFAAGNFLGPLVLGRLFDTIGRKPMIAGTYILSGVLLFLSGLAFDHHSLTAVSLTICWSVVFFFASAGVSAAYLTVSEVFPMETRALCIAVFYAVGTGLGGIIGPLLFAGMVATRNAGNVFAALAVGSALMVIGGICELVFGVKAERQSLESIATPLSAVSETAGT
jgi:MFS family permease